MPKCFSTEMGAELFVLEAPEPLVLEVLELFKFVVEMPECFVL